MPDEANWFGFVEAAPNAPRGTAELAEASRPDQVRIRLHVAGGNPDQKYEFEFSMDPSGSARCSFDNAGRTGAGGRESAAPATGRADLATPELREMSVAVASKASSAPMRPPAFPPGSLIGHLQIETSDGSVRTYFMADHEQAVTAGLPPPEEVASLTNRIYKACEEAIGTSALRP